MTREQLLVLRALIETLPRDPDLTAIDVTLIKLLEDADHAPDSTSDALPNSR